MEPPNVKAAKLHAEPQFSPLEPVFLHYRLPIPNAFREEFLRAPGESFRVVLEGTMHRIWYRPRWLKPLFWALGQAGILVPHIASNVPTTLRVEPGRDHEGRPYHVHVRDFQLPRP